MLTATLRARDPTINPYLRGAIHGLIHVLHEPISKQALWLSVIYCSIWKICNCCSGETKRLACHNKRSDGCRATLFDSVVELRVVIKGMSLRCDHFWANVSYVAAFLVLFVVYIKNKFQSYLILFCLYGLFLLSNFSFMLLLFSLLRLLLFIFFQLSLSMRT